MVPDIRRLLDLDAIRGGRARNTNSESSNQSRSILTVIAAALAVVALLAGAVMAADGEPEPIAEPTEIDAAAPEAAEDEIPAIVFPVAGNVSFWNDWHQPRDNGERLHLGTDIAAPRLTPVLAAVDGTVVRVGPDASGRAGNYVILADEDGWEYAYIHLNNDSPGTDDNTNPSALSLGPGIEVGVTVRAGQILGFVGDSGNAETTIPHLHFEIRSPGRVQINPYPRLIAAWELDIDRRCESSDDASQDSVVTPTPVPHLIAMSSGAIIAVDGAIHLGDLAQVDLDGPIVAAASSPLGGYWLLGADGGVFSFGNASFHGSVRSGIEVVRLTSDARAMASVHAALAHDGEIRAVDIVASPSGSGYWILMANGETVEFGDVGSLERPPVELDEPAVALALAPGGGAWIVARDGGVFAVGGAQYHGSLPALGAVDHDEIVSLITSSSSGYTLIDGAGAAFDFGSAATPASHATAGRCTTGTVTAAAGINSASHRILTTEGAIRTYGPIAAPLDDLRIPDVAVDFILAAPVIGGLT